jgi:LysM repeat protein
MRRNPIPILATLPPPQYPLLFRRKAKPSTVRPAPAQKQQNEEETLFEIEPNEVKNTPSQNGNKPKVQPKAEQFEVETDATKPTTKPNKTPTAGTMHVVAKGETLWSIARKYNISVEELRKLNNLENNSIAVGQRLRVK